ncbi:copper amine oxidase N-terminal domain-containing protein [Peptoniphilus sp. MSJ-1]|uniref:Copper amine oxidase N-terminal domain-containing protein n=1 Tax=Peptoniphilus ovalis TaxID=2841503 RepID=A0ABS6FH93_9FIRM|nr:copper amine oxidase N-terminal domain-containing protein [Peptoniphilus ovalis]MBU5668626.1 copper amine oxidase N-terminal domain-containing protein [Peptoniphilus ovalis]
MKILKKIMSIAILSMMMPGMIFAASNPRIVVNGKLIEQKPNPIIENNRTLVPIRFVAESLNYNVDFIETSRTVVIESKDSKIELRVNSNEAKVNSNGQSKAVNLEVPVKIYDDRTFVPIRFVAENLGTEVNWDNENRVVVIGDYSLYNPKNFKVNTPKVSKDFSLNYIYLDENENSLYISGDDIKPRADGFNEFCVYNYSDDYKDRFYVKLSDDKTKVLCKYPNGKSAGYMEVLNDNQLKFRGKVFTNPNAN